MSNFYNASKHVVARKPHRCSYCGEGIAAGETYIYQKGNWEGSWFESKMHPECFEDMCDSGDEEYTPYSNERPVITEESQPEAQGMIDKTKVLQLAKDTGLAINSPYVYPRDEVMNAYMRLCELAQADAQATIAELERQLGEWKEINNLTVKTFAAGISEAVAAETERCVEAVEFLLVDRRGKSLSFDMIVEAIRQGASNGNNQSDYRRQNRHKASDRRLPCELRCDFSASMRTRRTRKPR